MSSCNRLAHHSTESGLAHGGIPGERLVKDRAPAHELGPDCDLCGAGYVDNYMVLGAPEPDVTATGQRVADRLTSLGFTIHEDTKEAVSSVAWSAFGASQATSSVPKVNCVMKAASSVAQIASSVSQSAATVARSASRRSAHTFDFDDRALNDVKRLL